MSILQELIENLNLYVQSLNNQPNMFEYFASTICPIITTLALVIGGLFTLYKYLESKNYDVNLKILNEVYVPLYSYLVKQETFRYIAAPDSDWRQDPILEIKSTKTTRRLDATGLTQKQVTEGVCGCVREALLILNKETNMGLASTELITLLHAYEMLVHITNGNQNTPEKARAVLLQEKVELALRKEILRGYKYYHRKLRLQDTESELFRLTDEQIEILPQFSQSDVEKELEELRNIANSD